MVTSITISFCPRCLFVLDVANQEFGSLENCSMNETINFDHLRIQVRAENFTLAWITNTTCTGPFDILHYTSSNLDPCRSSLEELTMVERIQTTYTDKTINFSHNSLFRVTSSSRCCTDSNFFHPIFQGIHIAG